MAERDAQQAARAGGSDRPVVGERQRRQPGLGAHVVGGVAEVGRGVDQRAVEIEQHARAGAQRHGFTGAQCIR